MAACVVIGSRQDRQDGGWNTRFGISTRRISGRGVGLVIAAILAVTYAHPARAITGYELLEKCEATESLGAIRYTMDQSYCLFYLNGIFEGVSTALRLRDAPQLFCPAQTIQVGQMQLIYTNWARRNPQYLGRGSATAVLAAFAEAFLCR
jgi:hypothetical protein